MKLISKIYQKNIFYTLSDHFGNPQILSLRACTPRTENRFIVFLSFVIIRKRSSFSFIYFIRHASSFHYGVDDEALARKKDFHWLSRLYVHDTQLLSFHKQLILLLWCVVNCLEGTFTSYRQVCSMSWLLLKIYP